MTAKRTSGLLHCEQRDLLTSTPAGRRVTVGSLWAKLTREEIIAWQRWSGKAEQDAFGILPSGVEDFLSQLPPSPASHERDA